MMALAPTTSLTGSGVTHKSRGDLANGHSEQPFSTTSPSDAMKPAISLLRLSAAGVPMASHPLRSQKILQAGTANHKATHRNEQASARVMAKAWSHSQMQSSAGTQSM
jgi:hypothetical protein